MMSALDQSGADRQAQGQRAWIVRAVQTMTRGIGTKPSPDAWHRHRLAFDAKKFRAGGRGLRKVAKRTGAGSKNGKADLFFALFLRG